jgi:hypothetical protein
VLADVAQGEHLVEPGDHRQLLGLQTLDPGPPEDLEQVVLDLGPGVLHAILGVELLAPQVVGDRRHQGAQGDVERVGQRVGGVGGQGEGAEAGVGAAEGGRRRGGGLADPALAREQQDAGG